MKNLLRLSLSALLAVMLFMSCTSDGTPVQVNENPYALKQDSDISVLLLNIQDNADCYTIDYPITLSTYGSDYVIDQTFTIADDAALIAFIQGLGTGTYAIQYPFSVTNAGGVTVDVTSNASVEDTFETQRTACDACNAGNTLFRQAYESQTGTEEFTMDTFTHEYTFSVDANGSICSIGYMGETDTLEYLIEIVAPDATIIYTGTHTFSNTEMEYIALTTPVTLTADVEYIVRRSIPNADNGSGVGTLKHVQLPFTHNGIEIHQSRFYGGGGSAEPDNTKLPFIDFVFNPVE